MKKILLVFLCSLCALNIYSQNIGVIIKNGKVKEEPSSLGKTLFSASVGDIVTIIQDTLIRFSDDQVYRYSLIENNANVKGWINYYKVKKIDNSSLSQTNNDNNQVEN